MKRQDKGISRFEDLRRAMKLIRKFRGLEVIETAEKIGVHPSFISSIEGGRKKPNLRFMERFAAVMDVRVSLIFFFSERLQEDFRENLKRFIDLSERWDHILD